MTMCRVERKDLQKAIENHAAILKDGDQRLEIALIQYKADYKYSLWERLTGATKRSARSLWDKNNDHYWHSDAMESLVSEEAAIAAYYRFRCKEFSKIVQSESDDIYLSGEALSFYVRYKEKTNDQ